MKSLWAKFRTWRQARREVLVGTAEQPPTKAELAQVELEWVEHMAAREDAAGGFPGVSGILAHRMKNRKKGS